MHLSLHDLLPFGYPNEENPGFSRFWDGKHGNGKCSAGAAALLQNPLFSLLQLPGTLDPATVPQAVNDFP
jgi:hypothetical protein